MDFIIGALAALAGVAVGAGIVYGAITGARRN